ncbi:MAG: SCO family protein [Verrucomicrobia bacterium]|nr:SCO family protein [Verrucomicrobiota bacterium]
MWGLLLVVLLAASLFCAREWLRLTSARAVMSLPVMGAVPDFFLTERSGRALTLADLRGRVWVADFIFTYCAGPCPLMSQQMAGLQGALAQQPDVTLVTLTVDPERDTPEVLRDYARRYGASETRWLFLTGEKTAVRSLARDGFKLGATDNPPGQRQADEGEILHSTSFALVDRAGRIRGYYDGTGPAAREKLVRDVRALLRERAP